MEEETVSGEGSAMVFLGVVGISEYILVAVDVFRVVDECHGWVRHDKGFVSEDASEDADYLAGFC